MKTLSWIIVLAVLIVGGYFIFNNDNSNEMATENTEENINVASPDDIAVTPIEHATMVITWQDKVIYTDPVGGAAAFAGQPEPDLVLLTDIHGDHLNEETLSAVVKEKTIVVAPQAVVDEIDVTLPGTMVVLANGAKTTQAGFSIEAVPMYNFPETADSRHTKGRGNGYVVEAGGQRVYFSGDTGNIPEARALRDIDLAFVTMNLPFTMSVEDAAAMVLAMKPARVTPYHYRGQDGLSDTARFRDLVNQGDPNIEVDLMDFYPND